MKKLTLAFALLALWGCASDRLQSYVGRDITEAIMDNGQPTNTLDLPDGKRAFQWQETERTFVPPVAQTNGTVPGLVNGGSYSSTTTVSGGYTREETCLYTLIAAEDKERKTWIVTGFRKPSFNCEL